jgi:hypothetical protein
VNFFVDLCNTPTGKFRSGLDWATVECGAKSREDLVPPPDYRYDCKAKKVRVGTGQYFKWIEGFTTEKKGNGVNHTPVTVN